MVSLETVLHLCHSVDSLGPGGMVQSINYFSKISDRLLRVVHAQLEVAGYLWTMLRSPFLELLPLHTLPGMFLFPVASLLDVPARKLGVYFLPSAMQLHPLLGRRSRRKERRSRDSPYTLRVSIPERRLSLFLHFSSWNSSPMPPLDYLEAGTWESGKKKSYFPIPLEIP